MTDLTPREIVSELDRFIIGQKDAKRAVAVALRNRWRRLQLEEELLFPSNSQTAFFVALDVGEYFKLDSVNLKINGKEVANYLYTEREADALIRGGVHRLHMANLKTGEHELVAVFIGHGPNIREYRRGATMTFDKGIGAKYVELEITDSITAQQPEFNIKEWE